ncbi:MAG: diaminopimelate epimerase [Bacillota bacterium]
MFFTKMHGTGNDFILINCLEHKLKSPAKQATKMCQRHFGIGADGLILVLPADSPENDFKMRIFNADGSEAEMCGNGIRCFAHYLSTNNLTNKHKLRIETKAGIIKPQIINTIGDKSQVEVNMGQPKFAPEQIPVKIPGARDFIQDYEINLKNQKLKINCVSMGNPHTIIFLDNLEEIELENWGSQLENHEFFPEKTNVEFVKIISPKEVEMKVWERGSGITLSCGTGACAVVAAGIKKKLLNNSVQVNLPGGELLINANESLDSPLKMIGAACTVFTGNY